jgi:probable HAF family extracellular repeat protein
MKTKISSLFIAVALGVVWNASAGVTVTGLWSNSTLGGTWSLGQGGSSGGWTAVGESATARGYSHGFFANGGAITDLGTLPGGHYSRIFHMAWNSTLTSAYFVGYSDMSGGNYHAIVVPLGTGGSMFDLGTLGGAFSYAYDVNRSFQIVGEAGTASGNSHAFLYSGGSMTDLGTLGGASSQAYGISESGKVVGISDNGSEYHAFLYSGGVMTDLGTLGGASSTAFAVNDTGGIVGYSMIPGGTTRAFLYKNGIMTNLGTLTGTGQSLAYAINSSGHIAGYSSYVPNDMNTHASIYVSGQWYDLHALAASAGLLSNGSTPGFTTLVMATAVNDSNYVVGTGMYYNGSVTDNRSFVLQYKTN